MYTLDTNALLDLGNTRYKTNPDWFNSEQYYNCENFFSILSFRGRKNKRAKETTH